MTFVNNNTGGLGTNAYLEVRWFNEGGGSASQRYNVEHSDRAKAFYKEQKEAGLKPVLVQVSTVELLNSYND